MDDPSTDPIEVVDELTTIADLVDCARLACRPAAVGSEANDAIATTLAIASDRLGELKTAFEALRPTAETRHEA